MPQPEDIYIPAVQLQKNWGFNFQLPMQIEVRLGSSVQEALQTPECLFFDKMGIYKKATSIRVIQVRHKEPIKPLPYASIRSSE